MGESHYVLFQSLQIPLGPFGRSFRSQRRRSYIVAKLARLIPNSGLPGHFLPAIRRSIFRSAVSIAGLQLSTRV
jgi:hypothetical protein